MSMHGLVKLVHFSVFRVFSKLFNHYDWTLVLTAFQHSIYIVYLL